METKILYKLVYNDASFFSPYPISIGYCVGKESTPYIGKIFTFNCPKNAYKFFLLCCIRNSEPVKFLEGIGKNPSYIRKCSICLFNEIKCFWTPKNKIKVKTQKAPVGTVTVDSFTPTIEYNVEQFVEKYIN